MASNSCINKIFILFISFYAIILMASASDPDILTEFVVPTDQTNNTIIDGNFFTFTGLRALIGANLPSDFEVIKISMAEFPALNGQSVSYSVLIYPVNSTNPPHTHPRAAELLYLFYGTLQVGFVDTTNKLYTQTLQKGDLFVFPKGLIHFQYNADSKNAALAVSTFGSANPGTVLIPNNIFTTSIDDNILAESFKTDVATIKNIKTGLAPKR